MTLHFSPCPARSKTSLATSETDVLSMAVTLAAPARRHRVPRIPTPQPRSKTLSVARTAFATARSNRAVRVVSETYPQCSSIKLDMSYAPSEDFNHALIWRCRKCNVKPELLIANQRVCDARAKSAGI